MQTWRSELKEDPLERYEQLRDNPWLFLKWACYTLDEVDKENPIKLYPAHLDYLRLLAMIYGKRRKLAVPKSRRLTVSWTFIGLALHDCIFFRGRSWGLVSKKELDSLELVQRAKFVYDHIPAEIIDPALLPKLKRNDMQSSPPTMEFTETNSKLMGFPSGANQMRQRGFSGLFFDEAAFWEDAEAAYASAEPTIKGGGRMVMVSTRFPGFFKKVVYDQMDADDLNFPEVPPIDVKTPLEGVDVWENPINGFTVVDISHRANPAKRSPEYEKELRRALPKRLFEMEYGKSWANFEGKPVDYCDDFNSDIHLVRSKPDFHVGLPMLIGWDSSGLTPAALIGQMQEDQLILYKEIIGLGMGATRFCPMVAQYIAMHFPQILDLGEQTISWIDPAGLKKAETNERTYMSYIVEEGFKQVRPGPMTWERRKNAVSKRLVGLTRGKPKIVIYEQGCPILVAGLKGGYRYSDNVKNVEPADARPLKDIHSHIQDALQYLCGGLEGQLAEHYRIQETPLPKYGFQKQDKVERPQLRKRYG